MAEEKRERRGFLSLPRNGAAKKGEELAQKVNAGDVKHPHAGQPQASEGTTDQSGDAKAEVGKILKVQVDGEEVEVRDQIQLYATNEQVRFPFDTQHCSYRNSLHNILARLPFRFSDMATQLGGTSTPVYRCR